MGKCVPLSLLSRNIGGVRTAVDGAGSGLCGLVGTRAQPCPYRGLTPTGVCNEGAASSKCRLLMALKLIKIKVEIKELSLLQSQAARAEKFICY